jgi:PAS domain S-box-containing protein
MGKMANKTVKSIQTKLKELALALPLLPETEQWAEVSHELKHLARTTTRQEILLESVTAISDAASSISEIDELLQVSVNLIRDYFDFYYVAIFLTDESNKWFRLRAGTGEAGQALLQRASRRRIGQGSPIGECIQHRQALIALDVGEKAVRFKNPLLPDTRSEVALPLINRGQVIGALDIFSTEAAAFSQEDITLFQTLADQLANTIYNVNLVAENTRLLDQAEKSQRFLKTVIEHIPDPIFIKNKDHTLLEMNQANARIIGQSEQDLIGKTDQDFFPPELANKFYERDNQVFNTNQILVAEDTTVWGDGQKHTAYTRLIPIPNAAGQSEYLLGITHDVTESRAHEAEREQLLAEMASLYQASRALAEVLSEHQIFDVLFEQLRNHDPCEISAFRFRLVDNEPTWADLRANWQKMNNPSYPVGTRFFLPETPQARLLTSQAPLFIDNIATDDRLSTAERESFAPTAACSVAILPLAATGQTLGAILVYFTRPYTFTPEIQRLWLAITDQVRVALVNHQLIEDAAYRTVRMETAAEIASAASSILDLQELLDTVVALIRDRFNLYYVGAFLVDPPAAEEDGEGWAVLHAGTGEAGHIQLQKKHRLKIGGESMIGWSISHRQPRIALDVGKEAVRFHNPDLPKTRSEMALPLIYHDEAIGALTIQSEEQAAFSREDIIFLQTMADQLANAVKNAQLYEHAKERTTELEESRNFLNSIVQNIPMGIFVKDAQGLSFVQWNKANEELTGLKREEVIHKTDHDFFPKEEADFFNTKDREVLVSGKPLDIPEEPIHTGKNEIRLLHTRKIPILGTDGKPKYLLGISEDITERKQAEEALRASEERYRTIFEQSNDMIYITAPEGEFLTVNRAGLDLFGYTQEEMVGLSMQEICVDPTDQLKLRRILEKKGSVKDFEIKLRRQDGAELVCLINATLWHDHDGNLIGYQGIIHDMTERKQAEEAQRKMLARTQLLYNISEALATLINQQAAFETVLGEYLLLLNVSRGGIMLFDPANEYNELEALYIDGKVVEANLVFPAEEDLIAQYLRENPFPLTIEDVHTHSLTKHNQHIRGQVEAMLLIPIVTRGEVIGILGADATKKGHRFTHDDIEIGEAITDQLAIWLENRELLAEAQYRSDLLQTAAEISRAANSILNVNELINTSVNLIRDQFDFYYVGLFLVDEARGWAVLHAGTGEAGRIQLERNHQLKIGGGSMIGWCIQNRQARIALDVGKEAVRFQNPVLPDTRSEMALPLISRDQAIGALTVQSTERGAFSSEDITVLQTMSDQLANAIENARLFTRVTQAQNEAEGLLVETLALQKFSQKLAGTLRVKEILDIFFEACYKVMGFEYALFSLVDKYQNRVKAIAGFGVSEAHIKRANRSLDSSDIMADIVKSSKTEVITGWDDRFDRELFEAEGHADWLRVFVPITLRQENIGLVEVGFNKNIKSDLTDSQIRLLRTFIDQTALALDSAQRYEASQRAARREALIKEITTKVRASTNLDTILQTTVKEIGEALGSQRTYVHLVSPTNGETHPEAQCVEPDAQKEGKA